MSTPISFMSGYRYLYYNNAAGKIIITFYCPGHAYDPNDTSRGSSYNVAEIVAFIEHSITEVGVNDLLLSKLSDGTYIELDSLAFISNFEGELDIIEFDITKFERISTSDYQEGPVTEWNVPAIVHSQRKVILGGNNDF